MNDSPPALRMPDEVQTAVVQALGGGKIRQEFAWMSWAGTVWRLEGAARVVYVKRAAHLTEEHDRLAWLKGRWPVPEVIGLYQGFGDDWLLTHAVQGKPLSDRSIGWPPSRMAERLGEILREVHGVDATGCPFGIAGLGHVLVHGDYCLPNVLVDEKGRLSALVDVGLAGLGDAQVDLAAGIWTLQYNYGPGHAREFLEAYGAPAMTDAEIERLRRRYAR
jgi:aminoglycoside phosphotransferase